MGLWKGLKCSLCMNLFYGLFDSFIHCFQSIVDDINDWLCDLLLDRINIINL